MTTFFVDLWHDLREKRLWPVAVGLLAAIVAVPAILFKPASDAAPPAATAPHTGGAGTLPVVAVDSGPTVGSRLEAFNEKNPFKPMKDLAESSTADQGSGSGSGGSGSGGSSSGGSDAGLGSSSGGDSSSGGGSPSGGSGGSTGGTPSTTPTVQWFHYVADFSFGEPGSPKKFKSPATFTLLPDEANPSITFMGVADDHKSAVFFISDPAFEAGGEGDCNAKGAECRFVTLKLSESSNEETFTAIDGSVSYDLKLLAIKREDLSSDKTGNPKVSAKSAKGIGATGAGVATATEATASVVPGLIAGGPGVALETK
jgi:hypothetical protein